IRKISQRRKVGRRDIQCRGGFGAKFTVAGEKLKRFAQIADSMNLNAVDDSRFGGVLRGKEYLGFSLGACFDGKSQGTPDWAYGTGQSKFSGDETIIEHVGRLACGGKGD